jgi:hypothetical protein
VTWQQHSTRCAAALLLIVVSSVLRMLSVLCVVCSINQRECVCSGIAGASCVSGSQGRKEYRCSCRCSHPASGCVGASARGNCERGVQPADRGAVVSVAASDCRLAATLTLLTCAACGLPTSLAGWCAQQQFTAWHVSTPATTSAITAEQQH